VCPTAHSQFTQPHSWVLGFGSYCKFSNLNLTNFWAAYGHFQHTCTFLDDGCGGGKEKDNQGSHWLSNNESLYPMCSTISVRHRLVILLSTCIFYCAKHFWVEIRSDTPTDDPLGFMLPWYTTEIWKGEKEDGCWVSPLIHTLDPLCLNVMESVSGDLFKKNSPAHLSFTMTVLVTHGKLNSNLSVLVTSTK
jgi:hypothetical protein